MTSKLAIEGGRPVREILLPYGRHCLDDGDIRAVVEVLHSDWLTTGPKVNEFEEIFAESVGTRYAVAVSSGTAALHAAMHAIDIGPDDEVIVPCVTFVSTANAVVFQRGTPVFADVDADTLLIDPIDVEQKITSRTKAIVAVDYAGQPCDYDALRTLADRHNLILIADACHSLGATDKERRVGTLADLTVFSFHPVKLITAGEGGMVVGVREEYESKLRRFRNHGISSDHHQRLNQRTWYYEVVECGYNYRISDLQCALGLSQLRKLPDFIRRRRQIARQFDEAWSTLEPVSSLSVRAGVFHAYHLYVVQLAIEQLSASRAQIYEALQAEGIGVNVHYIPVHLHPWYRTKYKAAPPVCPVAEAAYERLLTLPLNHGMVDNDVRDVIDAVGKVIRRFHTP